MTPANARELSNLNLNPRMLLHLYNLHTRMRELFLSNPGNASEIVYLFRPLID